MGTKANPGKYDCLGNIGDEEPFFILRGQDILAAQLVSQWARTAEVHGTSPAKVAEARACAEAMRAWPHKKVPD